MQQQQQKFRSEAQHPQQQQQQQRAVTNGEPLAFTELVATLEALAGRQLAGRGRQTCRAAYERAPDAFAVLVEEAHERALTSPLGFLVRLVEDGDHLAAQAPKPAPAPPKPAPEAKSGEPECQPEPGPAPLSREQALKRLAEMGQELGFVTRPIDEVA